MNVQRAVLLALGAGLIGFALWRFMRAQGMVASDWNAPLSSDQAMSYLTFDATPPATGWLQGAYDTVTGETSSSAGVSSVSAEGEAAIKEREGLRLTAYPDGGSYSAGYGHNGVQPGTYSEAQADTWFAGDIANVEDAINGAVKVPLSQAQYDALADFVFNVGVGAFEGSTLLRLLNTGDYAGAAAQFTNWKYAAGAINQNLVARRASEASQFANG